MLKTEIPVMSTCRIVTRKCVYKKGATVDALILKITAILSGTEVAFEENVNEFAATSLTIATTNTFCGFTPSIQTAASLIGCVRLLASTELRSNGNNANVAKIDSWMDSVEQTVMPILRKQGTYGIRFLFVHPSH